MTRALSIDPGVSNGALLFTYSDTEPFAVEQWFQFPYGADGLAMWLTHAEIAVSSYKGQSPQMWAGRKPLNKLIVEKFTPHENEGFKLTLESVEPLVGEGVLKGRGFGPFIEWGEPSQQYFMGDPSLPKVVKRKLAEQFLETNGIKPTPRDVGAKDANDAISATLHAIAWLRRMRHQPTIRALFPDLQDQ